MNYVTSNKAIALAVFSKLESFRELSIGWHYGSGGPISERTLSDARAVLMALILQGFQSVSVSPGEFGDVLVTGSTKLNYISIAVASNGEMSFNYETNREEVCFEEGLKLTEIRKLIGEAAAQEWHTSGSFIQENSIAQPANSMTWRSHVPMTAGCQSSTMIARSLVLA